MTFHLATTVDDVLAPAIGDRARSEGGRRLTRGPERGGGPLPSACRRQCPTVRSAGDGRQPDHRADRRAGRRGAAPRGGPRRGGALTGRAPAARRAGGDPGPALGPPPPAARPAPCRGRPRRRRRTGPVPPSRATSSRRAGLAALPRSADDGRVHRSRLSAVLADVAGSASAGRWGSGPGHSARCGRGRPRRPRLRRPGRGASRPHGLVQRVDDRPRLHLDIETDDVEAEVRRLEALGASRVRQVETWWVLRDPAGLVFCVVEVTSPEWLAPVPPDGPAPKTASPTPASRPPEPRAPRAR